eukprot:119683-Chlamydomonas_euryale.AAC.1
MRTVFYGAAVRFTVEEGGVLGQAHTGEQRRAPTLAFPGIIGAGKAPAEQTKRGFDKAAARSFVMRLYNVLVGKLNFLQFKLTVNAATQDLLPGMKRKLE